MQKKNYERKNVRFRHENRTAVFQLKRLCYTSVFSIVLHSSSLCFYMFEIQIPVDARPVFVLKRRAFLFVIDILAHAKIAYFSSAACAFFMQNNVSISFSADIQNELYQFLMLHRFFYQIRLIERSKQGDPILIPNILLIL